MSLKGEWQRGRDMPNLPDNSSNQRREKFSLTSNLGFFWWAGCQLTTRDVSGRLSTYKKNLEAESGCCPFQTQCLKGGIHNPVLTD